MGTSLFKRAALAATGAAGLALSGAAQAVDWNMPYGVTNTAHRTWDLHMMMFYVCVAIGAVVFGLMFYSLVAHRRSRHPKAEEFHENTAIEITWTVIPFLILIAVAIPAAATLLHIGNTSNPDMSVKITGYQWLWKYDYPHQNISFYSRLDWKSDQARMLGSKLSPFDVKHYDQNVTHPLVLPIHKRILLMVTGGDVIHSWWVPALSIKRDAIPGFINEQITVINKPGTYRGECAELCGRDHAFMPIVVKALPVDQYEAWVKKQGGHVPWINSGSKSSSSKASSAQPSSSAQAAKS